MAKAIVVMGVSGSGKSSVGTALSEKLHWPFFDGDDFHSKANIEKMAAGHPLNDEDRQPWLQRLHHLIHDHLADGRSLIIACSALKKEYRDQLRQKNKNVQFVFLEGDFDLLWERMISRQDHYMKAEMLQSQLDTLEVPHNAVCVSIDRSIDEITKYSIQKLELN